LEECKRYQKALKELHANQPPREDAEPTGRFYVDYEAECALVGLAPHPHLLPRQHNARARAIEEKENPVDPKAKKAEDEVDPHECTALRVSGLVLDRGTIYALSKTLPACSTITRFELWNVGLNEELLNTLALILPATSIIHLEIDWSAPPEAWCALCKVFDEESKFETLSLRGNGIGDSGVEALAETLASNLTLKRLDLAENKFGSASASFLAAALDTNTCLESLSCANCGLMDDSLVLLCGVLALKPMSDEALEARKAQEAEIQAIIAENEANAGKKGAEPTPVPQLIPLETDEAGRILGPANTTLKELIITNSELSPEGARAAEATLSKNPGLSVVYLKRSNVSDEDEHLFLEPRLFLSEAKAARDSSMQAGVVPAQEYTSAMTEAMSEELPVGDDEEAPANDAMEVRALEVTWSQCEEHLTLQELQTVAELHAPGASTIAVVQAVAGLLGHDVETMEDWATVSCILVETEDATDEGSGDTVSKPRILPLLQEMNTSEELTGDADLHFKYYLDTVKWAERAREGRVSKAAYNLQGENFVCHCLYCWMIALQTLWAKRKEISQTQAATPIEPEEGKE